MFLGHVWYVMGCKCAPGLFVAAHPSISLIKGNSEALREQNVVRPGILCLCLEWSCGWCLGNARKSLTSEWLWGVTGCGFPCLSSSAGLLPPALSRTLLLYFWCVLLQARLQAECLCAFKDKSLPRLAGKQSRILDWVSCHIGWNVGQRIRVARQFASVVKNIVSIINDLQFK